MRKWFETGLLMSLGALSLTREKAEAFVEEIVGRGEARREEAHGLAQADWRRNEGRSERARPCQTQRRRVAQQEARRVDQRTESRKLIETKEPGVRLVASFFFSPCGHFCVGHLRHRSGRAPMIRIRRM